VSRRLYDQTQYLHGDAVQSLTQMSSWGAWMLGVAQIPFIINFFWSAFAGKKTEDRNPWKATTLEWAAPSPPPHGNFESVPVVYRGPYEYSVPGQPEDFSPQHVA
jgi:cytochrome c oxidase subunit 1